VSRNKTFALLESSRPTPFPHRTGFETEGLMEGVVTDEGRDLKRRERCSLGEQGKGSESGEMKVGVV